MLKTLALEKDCRPGQLALARVPSQLLDVVPARLSDPPGPGDCHLLHAQGVQVGFDTGGMKAAVTRN